jgi:Transposase DDE domain/Domain of unknown function (DUF4382)
LACLALASCGNTCVSGIFANGTGVILVKNSTPPPACPLSTGMGMMNVAVQKTPACEACTPSIRADHIFVTLQSIQLHSVFPDSTNSPEWLELAPQLLLQPRQIDLLGDSTPEILVQSALVSAGTYRELRLQFLPDSPADSDALPVDTSCGRKGLVEPVIGTLKEQRGMRQFQRRGRAATAVEWALASMAYNLSRYHQRRRQG